MDHSDTPVMHGLIGERGGVWRVRRVGAAPAGAEVAREEVVTEAVCVR